MTQGGTLSLFQAQAKRFCNQNWNGTNPAVQQRMAPGQDGANPSNSDQATLFNEQEKHLRLLNHKLRYVAIILKTTPVSHSSEAHGTN